jgi:hypothetical protein
MRPALLSTALVLISQLLNVACAHVVRIESDPGAEIFVNDQHVGTSPASYSETTGSPDAVKVTAKLHGKEKTVMVPRENVDMGAVGAGAAAGVGGCLASNLVLAGASLVFFPCAFAFPVSWALLGAGPGYGWYYGHKMPDNVRIDFDGGAVAMKGDEPDSRAAARAAY